MREVEMPEGHAENVSKSLQGKIGKDARRWKGDDAGYVAKHMWIVKHHGKADKCENDHSHASSRFEWDKL